MTDQDVEDYMAVLYPDHNLDITALTDLTPEERKELWGFLVAKMQDSAVLPTGNVPQYLESILL